MESQPKLVTVKQMGEICTETIRIRTSDMMEVINSYLSPDKQLSFLDALLPVLFFHNSLFISIFEPSYGVPVTNQIIQATFDSIAEKMEFNEAKKREIQYTSFGHLIEIKNTVSTTKDTTDGPALNLGKLFLHYCWLDALTSNAEALFNISLEIISWVKFSEYLATDYTISDNKPDPPSSSDTIPQQPPQPEVSQASPKMSVSTGSSTPSLQKTQPSTYSPEDALYHHILTQITALLESPNFIYNCSMQEEYQALFLVDCFFLQYQLSLPNKVIQTLLANYALTHKESCTLSNISKQYQQMEAALAQPLYTQLPTHKINLLDDLFWLAEASGLLFLNTLSIPPFSNHLKKLSSICKNEASIRWLRFYSFALVPVISGMSLLTWIVSLVSGEFTLFNLLFLIYGIIGGLTAVTLINRESNALLFQKIFSGLSFAFPGIMVIVLISQFTIDNLICKLFLWLLWFIAITIPNHIYFQKRCSLFFIQPNPSFSYVKSILLQFGICIVCLIAVLLLGLTNLPSVPTSRNRTTSSSSNITDAANTTYVWVTESGTKYHYRYGCSGMEDPQKVPIDEAISDGYTPCKKCASP